MNRMNRTKRMTRMNRMNRMMKKKKKKKKENRVTWMKDKEEGRAEHAHTHRPGAASPSQ